MGNSTPPTGFGSNSAELVVIMIIFSLLILRRLWYGVNGRRYSSKMLFRTPLLYAFLLISFEIDLINQPIYILGSLLLVFPGLVVGDRLGVLTQVYLENNVIFYRRSTILLVMTTVLLFVRLLMEFFINFTEPLIIALFNAMVAFSLGIYIGELLLIRTKASSIRQESRINGVEH